MSLRRFRDSGYGTIKRTVRRVGPYLKEAARRSWGAARRNPVAFAATLANAGSVAYQGYNKAKQEYKKVKKRQASKRKRGQTKVGLSSHNDMSVHYFKIDSKKKAKKTKMFKYSETKQGCISGIPGDQRIHDVQGLCSRTQLTGAVVSDSRSNGLTWAISPFELNPYSATRDANSLYTGASLSDSDRFHLLGCEYQLNLLNMENIPLEFEVLICKAVTNHNYSPTQWWEQCVAEERLGQNFPTTAPNFGQSTAVSGVRGTDSRGNHPSRYRSFKKKWRIIGKYKVVIQPGDQHLIKSSINWNRTFSRLELLATSNVGTAGTNEYVGGVTVMPMMILNGGMVGLAGPAVGGVIPDAIEVLNGPTKLGYIQTVDYSFAAVPMQRFRTARTFEGTVEPTGTLGVDYNLTIIDDNDQKADVEDA